MISAPLHAYGEWESRIAGGNHASVDGVGMCCTNPQGELMEASAGGARGGCFCMELERDERRRGKEGHGR
jgi:hypothetical protein